MDRNQVRIAILTAAGRVFGKYGLTGTTIDAIAEEAGMSKGGILYHFPNKRKIISEAILAYEALVLQLREEVLETFPPDTPCRAARAAIKVQLDIQDMMAEDAHSRIGVLSDPEYRKIIGDMKKRLFKEIIKDVRHPETMALVMFILDGMWINRSFRPHAIPREVEEKAIERVLALVDESCGSGNDGE